MRARSRRSRRNGETCFIGLRSTLSCVFPARFDTLCPTTGTYDYFYQLAPATGPALWDPNHAAKGRLARRNKNIFQMFDRRSRRALKPRIRGAFPSILSRPLCSSPFILRPEGDHSDMPISLSLSLSLSFSLSLYIYIYIYIYRERECVYIYIYIYIEREREMGGGRPETVVLF